MNAVGQEEVEVIGIDAATVEAEVDAFELKDEVVGERAVQTKRPVIDAGEVADETAQGLNTVGCKLRSSSAKNRSSRRMARAISCVVSAVTSSPSRRR